MDRGGTGFTLVELLVVVSILVLVLAVAIPAVGPMLASNQQAAATTMLSGILATAQTRAVANGSPVGVRFERAVSLSDRGVILDVNGRNPIEHGNFDWSRPDRLPFQRIRIVDFATDRHQVFKEAEGARYYDLPRGVWAAPSYMLDQNRDLTESGLGYDPRPYEARSITFSLLETFFVVFDGRGELTRFDAVKNVYADRSQRQIRDRGVLVTPWLRHPDESARSLLLYDRAGWEALADDKEVRRDFLRRQGRPLHISRVTGAIIEGAGP